jgi:hypothetical protein
MIESIRRHLEDNKDPLALPEKAKDIEFWI